VTLLAQQWMMEDVQPKLLFLTNSIQPFVKMDCVALITSITTEIAKTAISAQPLIVQSRPIESRRHGNNWPSSSAVKIPACGYNIESYNICQAEQWYFVQNQFFGSSD
jgi:hypothetical protein